MRPWPDRLWSILNHLWTHFLIPGFSFDIVFRFVFVIGSPPLSDAFFQWNPLFFNIIYFTSKKKKKSSTTCKLYMSLIYTVAFVRKTCVKYKLINTYDTYLHKRQEVKYLHTK